MSFFGQLSPYFVNHRAAAKIWENDEVHCESWFDLQKGGIAFLLDVMVAQGDLIRRWSEEQGEFAYRKTDIQEGSHLTV